LKFIYQPSGETFHDDDIARAEARLRFCFTADPVHPINGSIGYLDNVVSYDTVMSSPSSVQFAEWNAWTLEPNFPVTDWLYNYDPVRAGGASTALNDRFSYFGAISCFDSYQNGATRIQMTHGMLWIETEMEFADPSPEILDITYPSYIDGKGRHDDSPPLSRLQRAYRAAVSVLDIKDELKIPYPELKKTPSPIIVDEDDLPELVDVRVSSRTMAPGGATSSSSKTRGLPPLPKA
jgi:hypothetical protein